jgi:hypothetical protein
LDCSAHHLLQAEPTSLRIVSNARSYEVLAQGDTEKTPSYVATVRGALASDTAAGPWQAEIELKASCSQLGSQLGTAWTAFFPPPPT